MLYSVKAVGEDKEEGVDWEAWRDRHGQLTWGALAICDFHLRFIYVLPAFEGKAHDSRLWDFAINKDLVIPKGRWVLGDSAFPLCDEILTPYIGVRYHLQEWSQYFQRGRWAYFNLS